MFQIEQKNLLQEQKIFVNENHVQSEHINALYFSRLCVAFCEISWSCMAFFDRELYSKVLKEAFLLFLLAWKHSASSSKNFTDGTKNASLGTKNVCKQICSKSNKNSYKRNKNVRNENCSLVRLRASYCGLVWPLMVLHDLIWQFCTPVRPLYGLVWSFYGLV